MAPPPIDFLVLHPVPETVVAQHRFNGRTPPEAVATVMPDPVPRPLGARLSMWTTWPRDVALPANPLADYVVRRLDRHAVPDAGGWRGRIAICLAPGPDGVIGSLGPEVVDSIDDLVALAVQALNLGPVTARPTGALR